MGGPEPAELIPGAGRAAPSVAPFLALAHRRWLADDPAVRWRRRPASLVFGDVSGFTALSEQLAAKGKIGAEELTEVLNGAVGRLLDAAAAHGGDLLKYGGDAVLLAFEGPGHERRATQAAAALPAALRGPADRGGVELAMSIGVATGELDLFLVGEDHRELVVCGPLVTSIVRLEHEAQAGEVLADTTTAAAVNDARWSELDRGGHLLLMPPPPSTVGLALSQVRPQELGHADLLGAVPVSLRPHIGSGGDGEHRQVAVAFVQVLGVDELLASDGHDAVADALDAVIRTTQEACALHRTTFLSTDGDDGAVKMILTAGAPDAGTDDIGRLLLVARKVAATRCALPVRVGVHHGRAFAVEVGNERRRVYTVLGDSVNLAARVMGRSESGTVLATDSTLLSSRTRFAATNLEPFSVKGKSELVVASVVGQPLGGGGDAPPPTTPLVGRERELATLLQALEDVRAGTGRIVVLEGDAGIGKSRLLAEVVAAAPELPQLHVTGGAYAAGSPYFAVRATLRRLLGLDPDVEDRVVVDALLEVLGPGGEPWLPLLAPAFGVTLPDTAVTAPVEARFRRPRSHALVTDLLRQLLPDRALLVVEDGHWLDDASTELLHHLLGAFEGVPWLVVVSRRAQAGGLEVPASDAVAHVALGPIDPTAAADLLQGSSEERFPPWVLQALLERGAGNPLFLEQLRASASAGTEVDDLPATVEAVIAARIDTLDPARRRQLRAASVLGQRFPRDLLQGLVDATSDPLVDLAGFLEADEPGWLRFQHALVRDGAYEGLSYRSRRELHGRIGELIEADTRTLAGRAELLSLHYAEAQRWESAWRWSVLAAERSAASEAPVEAARFLRRAVAAAVHLEVDPAQLLHVYARLADAEELNGRLDDAAEALTRARRLTDDPVRLAHLLQRHGRISDRAGSYVAAQRWFGRGLRALDDATGADAEGVRIDLVVAKAATKMRQGGLREAVALLETAVDDAEAAGHRQALAKGCNLLSTILHDLGRTEEAARYLDRSVPLFEELGDLAGQGRTLNNRGVEAYYDGDWDSAAARWRRSAQLNEQAGDVIEHAMVLSNLGEILSDRGQLEQAEELFRQALAVARACRFTFGVGLILGNLGRVLTRAGQLERAGEALVAAEADLRAVGATDLLVETRIREAERRLMQGDSAGAAALADQARIDAAQEESRFLLAGIERVAGLAAAQQGRWDDALTLLERSVEAARTGAVADLAWSHDALAKVSAAAGQIARSWGHRATADEALARLGIERVLDVPLPTA